MVNGAAGVGPVTAVSWTTNRLDIFVVRYDGQLYYSRWPDPSGWTYPYGADSLWTPWAQVPGGLEVAPCAPVCAVVSSGNWVRFVNLFAVALDGHVYHKRWLPITNSWSEWVQVGSLETVVHAQVTAVSRAPGYLDVFVTDVDGNLMTTAVHPGSTSWPEWWSIPTVSSPPEVPPGAPLAVASRSAHMLDLFTVGTDEFVHQAHWQPEYAQSPWSGWWKVGAETALPGSHLGVVSRAPDKLDLFVVRENHRVYWTTWEPPALMPLWPQWEQVGGETDFLPRARVTAVSRAPNLLDIYAVAANGHIMTNARHPGETVWRSWWRSPDGGTTLGGGPVGAVSRSPDKLDIFVVGMTNGGVYWATWKPGYSLFHGWWRIRELVCGTTNPHPSQWARVGTSLAIENTAWSDEAQGVAAGSGHWYLVSNGNKTVRKYHGGTVVASVEIPVPDEVHLGAPSFYRGHVYVPSNAPKPFPVHTGRFGVWRLNAALTSAEWIEASREAALGWCAVNPLNGRLYTSHPGPKDGVLAFAHDRDTLKRVPEDDVHSRNPVIIQGQPYPIRYVQGGVFTRRGRLILVCGYKTGPGRLFCFSAITGFCYGTLYLGHYGHWSSEAESVTKMWWNWDFYGATIRTDVHVGELANDVDDDFYLHSYAVPEPELL